MMLHTLSPFLFASLMVGPAFTPQSDDIAGIQSEERQAGDDDHKRYFLIGDRAHAPTTGHKLLLVLPGGNGSADFQGFVKRIYKNALPDGYLVAQLVAPQWSPDQSEQVVWPAAKLKWKGMQFTTEEFVEAVVADIRREHTIDPRFVFALGWSSGGPPCYASSLRKDTAITGTFVAMSVFKKRQLSGLGRAKGKAYYLLHSPEDFIPIRMAGEAVEVLQKRGAKVELKRVAGGHGWHGDVFGNLRQGFEWLEKQQP